MERPRGVADVSSMHMVLNNQISLKLMTSMLAVTLVPYPVIHASRVYTASRIMQLSEKLDAPVVTPILLM